MNSFQRFMDGLYDEETNQEQIERLVKLVLSPDELAEREKMKVTKKVYQLPLFPDG